MNDAESLTELIDEPEPEPTEEPEPNGRVLPDDGAVEARRGGLFHVPSYSVAGKTKILTLSAEEVPAAAAAVARCRKQVTELEAQARAELDGLPRPGAGSPQAGAAEDHLDLRALGEERLEEVTGVEGWRAGPSRPATSATWRRSSARWSVGRFAYRKKGHANPQATQRPCAGAIGRRQRHRDATQGVARGHRQSRRRGDP